MVGNDGSDITDMVLASPNYNFILVAYNLEKSDLSQQEKINQMASYCQSKGFPFYCLTADGEEGIEKFIEKTNAPYPFYNTDEITLKTIVRSNPGLVLLKEGTILGKWHYNDIPEIENTTKNFTQLLITDYKRKGDKYYIYTLVLLGAFLSSFYVLIRKNITHK
jgi:triosephosphate isomerase